MIAAGVDILAPNVLYGQFVRSIQALTMSNASSVFDRKPENDFRESRQVSVDNDSGSIVISLHGV